MYLTLLWLDSTSTMNPHYSKPAWFSVQIRLRIFRSVKVPQNIDHMTPVMKLNVVWCVCRILRRGSMQLNARFTVFSNAARVLYIYRKPDTTQRRCVIYAWFIQSKIRRTIQPSFHACSYLQWRVNSCSSSYQVWKIRKAGSLMLAVMSLF